MAAAIVFSGPPLTGDRILIRAIRGIRSFTFPVSRPCPLLPCLRYILCALCASVVKGSPFERLEFAGAADLHIAQSVVARHGCPPSQCRPSRAGRIATHAVWPAPSTPDSCSKQNLPTSRFQTDIPAPELDSDGCNQQRPESSPASVQPESICSGRKKCPHNRYLALKRLV